MLKILQDLEIFRHKLNCGETQAGGADWVVRACEAIVAEHAGYNNRATWAQELRERGAYGK